MCSEWKHVRVSFYASSSQSDRDDYWTIKVIKLPAAKKTQRNATKAFCRFSRCSWKKKENNKGMKATKINNKPVPNKCDRWFFGCFKFGASVNERRRRNSRKRREQRNCLNLSHLKILEKKLQGILEILWAAFGKKRRKRQSRYRKQRARIST